MCVDVSKETLHSLVALILQYKSVLVQQDVGATAGLSGAGEHDKERGEAGAIEASVLDETVVLSAVNVLTNQMFQLLRGATCAAVRRVSRRNTRRRVRIENVYSMLDWRFQPLGNDSPPKFVRHGII